MTSSPDTREKADALPPALSSMWRLCKLGYRHEPRTSAGGVLARAAVGAAGCAARALVQAARRRRARRRLVSRAIRRRCARRLGHGDVVPADRQHACAAPLPRQGDDRARVARRHAAGVDRHHRAPGTAGVPRSARRAAQSGLHAGPHVHVALHDVWMDPAARRHDRAARLDPSGARAAGALCASDRADLDVAAGCRAKRLRARRASEPAGPPPVRHRDDGDGREGSACHRYRRSPGQGTAAGVGIRDTGRLPPRAGVRRHGTRPRGRSSAPAMSARSSSSHPGLAHLRAMCS